MNELFSENLYLHTEATRRSLHAAVAHVSCAEIQNQTEEALSERFLPDVLLFAPTLEPEPHSKELDETGASAIYAHCVTNGDCLRFKPSTLQFGGWPSRISISGEALTITFRADENPQPKERHAAILKQLLANIAALRNDIERHNSLMRHTLTAAIQERKEQCKKIDQRRLEL